jgi:organic hydroperoxide reductase OsmC/OhrA
LSRCGKAATSLRFRPDAAEKATQQSEHEKEVVMGIVKAFRYVVSTNDVRDRLFTVDVVDKPSILVSTPREFGGDIDEAWSPEELLVGAVAACYRLTLTAVARRRDVPIESLQVGAKGHLEHSTQLGGYAFTVIELEVDVGTSQGHEAELEQLATRAKDLCIVGRALDVPVHLFLRIRPSAPAIAA